MSQISINPGKDEDLAKLKAAVCGKRLSRIDTSLWSFSLVFENGVEFEINDPYGYLTVPEKNQEGETE